MAEPLSLAEFWGPLVKEAGATFYLPGVRQHSRTAGGEVLSAIMGVSLWQGEVTAIARNRRAAEALQAQIEDLDRAGDPFLIHPRICGPAHDPDGSIAAAHNPVIGSLHANNRQLRIDGLLPGYQLQLGEFLSITYGTNPLRHGLHRVQTLLATANGQGRITVQVTPHIRPGAVVGAAVTLYKPVCKAVIKPGSIQWPGNAAQTRLRFEFIQTLR